MNRIAYDSFMNFWCYPNPLDITGDNKEICDLLIVFDGTCVIVSVKNYSFDGESYSRYFKKTTKKAIRQIKGAERKLFGDRQILLKHPDRDAEPFPKLDISKVVRIVVNLNTSVKYYQTSIFEGDSHFTIMDAESWYDAVRVMNTFPDFIKYLEDRYSLFNKYPTFILPREEHDFDQNDAAHLWDELNSEMVQERQGLVTILGKERDLIAIYIKEIFSFPDDLKNIDTNILTLKIDGEWDKLQKSDLSKKLSELESESYFVDHIVGKMSGSDKNSHKLAKMLYRLDRFDRLRFAKKYLKYHKDLAESDKNILFNRTHVQFPDCNLVFFYFDDLMPSQELEPIISACLMHHAYLYDYNLQEVGLIGVSKSGENYVFGFTEPDKIPLEERSNRDVFEKLGWQVDKVKTKV